MPDDRDERAGGSLAAFDRVRDVGEKQQRHIEETEGAVPRAGRFVVDAEGRGGEEPVRVVELAARDGAVVEVVAGGARLDHEASGKQERVASVVDILAGVLAPEADGAGDVVEAPCLRFQVQTAVAGGDGLVVHPAGDAEMACGVEVARCPVVVDVVGFDQTVAVAEAHVAIEGVLRPILREGVVGQMGLDLGGRVVQDGCSGVLCRRWSFGQRGGGFGLGCLSCYLYALGP